MSPTHTELASPTHAALLAVPIFILIAEQIRHSKHISVRFKPEDSPLSRNHLPVGISQKLLSLPSISQKLPDGNKRVPDRSGCREERGLDQRLCELACVSKHLDYTDARCLSRERSSR